jgi:hypothetical protein
MADKSHERPNEGERRIEAGYEPPRVEKVLTPAELERETLYAGAPGGSPGPG